ncbi:MAG TPA: HdeA/HdeB family chaperone [Candidatus Eisenbacteria bacterium]|nr:HdeA/HdeB family chaperone [Candidatus Eisenbacteria bacterium]
MQTGRVVGLIAAGMMLGGLAAANPASATSKQVDQITCEEFLALNESDRNKIAFWVDGYQAAKGEAAVGTVAFDKFGQPIGALVDDCKKTPKETLWQKLKSYL